MTVTSGLRRAAAQNHSMAAVRSYGKELTYGEVWDRGVRVANGLRALGLQPGDRLATLEDNCLESSDLIFGAAIANVARVPLYRKNSGEAHRKMIMQTGCKALFVSTEALPEIEGIDLEGVQIVLRDEGYEDWLAKQSNEDPQTLVDPDDIFVIRHSSGTTGTPKGAVLTHQAWVDAGRDIFYMVPPVNLGDRCLLTGPISHGSGYLLWPVWMKGGCAVVESHDPERTIDLFCNEDIAYYFGVPIMIEGLVQHAGEKGSCTFPALKAILIAGAPMFTNLALKAHEVFGDVLYQWYGQTEVAMGSCMGPKEWFSEVPGSEPLRSVGRIAPFCEVEARDENNQPVPVGESGEIAVRCDGRMRELWGQPEMTAERLIDGLGAHGRHRLHRRQWLSLPGRSSRRHDHFRRI
ncbi:MAG: long-chain fatty acid--CoA ligase [Halieaceae bacterium]|nr:long-chain fatty acid--CoA ligase [Halieaceae bacterium]